MKEIGDVFVHLVHDMEIGVVTEVIPNIRGDNSIHYKRIHGRNSGKTAFDSDSGYAKKCKFICNDINMTEDQFNKLYPECFI